MRQVSHKVRLAVRLINIKQFGRFAGEQEVERLSISARLKYKMCHMSELATKLDAALPSIHIDKRAECEEDRRNGSPDL